MTVYTIGFTKTTAESFFSRLSAAGVRRVVDVRLNNVSQLAGFAKKSDLPYFLETIAGIDYEHRPDLAPTQDIIDRYRKGRGGWEPFRAEFLALMAERGAENMVTPESLDGACLLCSESDANQCHRSLVVEYLNGRWGDLDAVHL